MQHHSSILFFLFFSYTDPAPIETGFFFLNFFQRVIVLWSLVWPSAVEVQGCTRSSSLFYFFIYLFIFSPVFDGTSNLADGAAASLFLVQVGFFENQVVGLVAAGVVGPPASLEAVH